MPLQTTIKTYQYKYLNPVQYRYRNQFCWFPIFQFPIALCFVLNETPTIDSANGSIFIVIIPTSDHEFIRSGNAPRNDSTQALLYSIVISPENQLHSNSQQSLYYRITVMHSVIYNDCNNNTMKKSDTYFCSNSCINITSFNSLFNIHVIVQVQFR